MTSTGRGTALEQPPGRAITCEDDAWIGGAAAAVNRTVISLKLNSQRVRTGEALTLWLDIQSLNLLDRASTQRLNRNGTAPPHGDTPHRTARPRPSWY